jgi:hypothetical protein
MTFQSRNEWLDYLVGRRAPDHFRSAGAVNVSSGLLDRLEGSDWVEVSRGEWLALPIGRYEFVNRAGPGGSSRLLVRSALAGRSA